MTTTLPNGTRVPDVASTSWAGDLEVNWQLLDAAIGAIGSNVQTNRPNTWTAEQTFSEPIVGNLTGTASKAGADEDGTSIKTGYGKLAGNQTWSGENKWGTNLLTVKDSAFTKGTTVTTRKQNLWKFTDSNDSVFSIWEAVQYTNGKQGIRLNLTNKYKNGALDPTGNDTPVYFEFLQKESDGQTILKWANGLIDNGIFPIDSYSLGNNAYQWSSVYAQTYYYNGTAWGLDKYNTWTNSQVYKLTGTEVGSTTAGYIALYFTDKNNANLGFQRTSVYSDGRTCMAWKVYNTDSNSQPISSSLEYYISKADAKVFAPGEDATIDLGTSTYKWKSLNGVNPGALSLPDISSFVELDKTDWNLDGTATDIIASGDGWIQVVVSGNSTSYVVLQVGYYGYPNCYYRATGNAIANSASAMIPVKSGQGVRMFLRGTSIYMARFFPMLGNV